MTIQSQEAIELQKQIDERFCRTDKKFTEIVELLKGMERSVDHLTAEVEPIVEIHRDMQGVARVMNRTQKFGLWLAKLWLIGGALYFVYNAIIKFIDNNL